MDLMGIAAMTARTELGAADLVPFLLRDRRLPTLIHAWEREPAVLALADMAWLPDRIARATGLTPKEVRDLLRKHRPAPAAPVSASPAAPVSQVSARTFLNHLDERATARSARKGTAMNGDVKNRIDALVSMNGRKDQRIAELERLLAERTVERDRARDLAVRFEQQVDAIRAGLVADAGDVRAFPERLTDEWVKGQYQTLLDSLADVLEITGEHYPDRGSAQAAADLAEAFDAGAIDHAGQMLPEALEIDDEAREAALREEYAQAAFGCGS